jgi:uncharacterized membrane protein
VRRIGLGAFVAYLVVPEVAFFVLLGIATTWWIAGLIAGGTFAAVLLAFGASRSRGSLGRVFGTTDYDPLDYAEWTRYLVIRPLIVSLPAGVALSVAIVLTSAYNASLTETVGIGTASGVIGFALGGVVWLWFEKRWRAAEDQPSRERRRIE